MDEIKKDLYPGYIFEKDGVTYCIRRVSNRSKCAFAVNIDIESGDEVRIPFDELRDVSVPKTTESLYDLEEIDPEDWEIALERYNLVRPLLGMAVRKKSDVADVAKRALVSTPTVYRWIEKFSTTRRVSAFLRRKRNDIGVKRLDRNVEIIISQLIENKLLTNQQIKPAKLYRSLVNECRSMGYDIPHANTLLARVRQISSLVFAKKRQGKNAELAFSPIKGTIPWQETPYSLVQIDHTVVDIILVDSVNRLPLKRPWLTLAIDVNTRMVAGYYIAFDSPGVLGTGICISNLILPKQSLLSKFGVSMNWPCQGIPGIIHVDNAREFRGNTLKMACNEYGIELKFRKIKTPQYGAHIERLMGTFMAEVHMLPGTTFSKPSDLGDYVPEKEAAMTLEEFEKWLLHLINAYQNRKHSELNMSPIQKFFLGLQGDDETPGTGILPMVEDDDKLKIDFLPLERRSVQPYGIQLDNIFYYADVLTRWIGARDPGKLREARKFVIRRDPRDISYILFYDPELRRYFRIPYRNARHPAISLWELRAVLKYLSDIGKKDIQEEEIFAAYKKMQDIADGAKLSTKKAKSLRLAEERKSTVKRHPTPMAIADSIFKGDSLERAVSSSEVILPFDEIDDL